MKFKNRVLSFLLVVCMLATLLPVSAMAIGADRAPVAERTEAVAADAEAAEPQTAEEDATSEEQTPEEYRAGLAEALEANQPEEAQSATVTAKEVENPGLDLKQNLNRNEQQTIQNASYAEDETVRVIVVLEDKGLMEQGFTTAQIASANAKVERQAETLAKRQDTVLTAINRVVDEPVEAKYRYSVALNGLAVEVPYGDLEEIQNLPGVKTAFVAPKYELPADMTGETVADPYTFSSKDMIGSAKTWETLGYTGKGMRIAIIDTGLDLDHPSFTAAPELTATSLTVNEVAKVLPTLNAYKQYKDQTLVAPTAQELYRNDKVPFGFNYVDTSLDITHDNDTMGYHGTHVAGIAAANAVEGTTVVGVAPDAQLIILKVFGRNGGAFFDDIMAALEDAIRLNVDAVNMSLGSPAGFTSEATYIDEVFERIEDSDMIAAIAAGNSFSAAFGNGYHTDRNLTCDPDNSLVSSPGTYAGGTIVASVENMQYMSNYLTVGDAEIPFNDVGAYAMVYWAGQELTYVMVPGYGTVEDFSKVDVKGKIAVVSRGSYDADVPLSFVEKQENAFNAGAMGLIVYDNVDGDMTNMVDAKLIPNVFVSKASGAILAENAVDGVGTLVVQPYDKQIPVDNPIALEMSDFSSWGVNPDLELTPDITAPGGNIYSTIDEGGYGTMSGTSMASPHIAGMSALVLQYIRDQYSFTNSKIHTVAEALLMSTAEPLTEPSGVLYSPRKQGSGSANVYKAITTPVYLTVGGSTPKASCGDDDLRTGVYNFSFEVNNLTDKAQSYLLDGSALTDQVDLSYANYGYYFMGETSRELDATVTFCMKNGVLPTEYDYNVDGETDMADVQALLDAVNGLSEVKAGYDFNGDGKTNTADAQALYELVQEGFTALNVVNVPAGGSVKIYATVTLSDADKAYMDKYYENGIYVDGFVRLYAQNEDAVDLSLPFLGFYGDWSDARVFDCGWYTSPDVEFNRYYSVFFTKAGGYDSVLGWNPYLQEEYDDFHNVLSPNGDGNLDVIDEIYLSLMRNAKLVDFTYTNEETGKMVFHTGAEYVRKSFWSDYYSMSVPMVVSQYCPLFSFRNLPNNMELKMTINAWLDDGDNLVDDTYSTPVYIDTEKPVLYADDMKYVYDAETDTRTLEFDVSDNHGIALVAALTEAGSYFDAFTVEDRPGEKIHVSMDVTDFDSTFLLAVCDYGCNETLYEVTFSGNDNIKKDAFFGYRCYSTLINGGYLYPTEGNNGWYSFETPDNMLRYTSQAKSGDPTVYAAEYVDGYILGIDANSTIFAMKAGDWTRTPIGKLELDGKAYLALDMAFDYTTNTLYVLTDELTLGAGGHLVTLNYHTGEITDLGVVTGIDSESKQGVTLACDNEGVLYTVDYSTGDLYTINKETVAAAFVGKTGYNPSYVQSMTVDHATDKLYWAAYAGYNYRAVFGEVDKTTGEFTIIDNTMYNGEITGLFKPYRGETDLYPESAKLDGLVLSKDALMMCAGNSESLQCRPLPFYADMGEISWTSSNKSVATVENGIVTAVGEGEAVITATANGVSATCRVTVGKFSANLRLYDPSYKHSWVSLDAAAPQEAKTISSSIEPTVGFMSAAYADGYVYAADYSSRFYRLNPMTMEGDLLGYNRGTLYAMAFNYNDAYMYGLQQSGRYFYLSRVNTSNGDTEVVQYLDEETFGIPGGGLAIDYDGNFYTIVTDATTGETTLLKFHLENDEIVGLERASLAQYTIGLNWCSMVYSGENEGIFWADGAGQLLWIDVSDMENVKSVVLGSLPGVGTKAWDVAMFEIPENEHYIPYAEITSATIQESYSLLQNKKVNIGLDIQPWNAKATASYSVKDPTVATVDGNGVLTGVGAGETTVGVYVQALDETLEADVKVIPSTGNLRAFVVWNFNYTQNFWIDIPDTDPASAQTIPPQFPFEVYAGAYYDGTIYACGRGSTAQRYRWHLLKINPEDYTYEMVEEKMDYYLCDMGMDYTTGTMYGITGEPCQGKLAQVDLETGRVSIVGDTGLLMIAMTVDGQGRIFGVAEGGNLYQIDKDTAEATLVGYTGVGSDHMNQSLYYDPDTGNTYWTAASGFMSSSLRLLDLETANSTYLGVVGYYGGQITSLYTIPDKEPTVPETVQPTGVDLDERNTVAVGQTLTLDAKVLPFSVSSVDQTITWTSDDESVATVKDGVVTGVSEGVVTITATTVNGCSDTCTIHVTAKERSFYAYDMTNTRWISFSPEDPTNVTEVRDDKEGETPIATATWTGEALYAFDGEGRFYSIDPDTFERTLIGDGIYGMSIPYDDNEGGVITHYDLSLMPVDLSYDAATGKLYLAVQAYIWKTVGISGYYMPILARFYEVDMATGEVEQVFETGWCPGSLLVQNGMAYFVDCYVSGRFNYVDLNSVDQTLYQPLIVPNNWGQWYYGRSFICDEYTGTLYALRDKNGKNCTLGIFTLGDTDFIEIGRVDTGVSSTGLFIR